MDNNTIEETITQENELDLKVENISVVEKKIRKHMEAPRRDDFVMVEHDVLKRPQEYKGFYITETSQITSSPEIVLGPDTMSMVDEFIKEEERIKEVKRKGYFRRIIEYFSRCC